MRGGCLRVVLGPHIKGGGKGMPIRVPPMQRGTSAGGGDGGGEETVCGVWGAPKKRGHIRGL